MEGFRLNIGTECAPEKKPTRKAAAKCWQAIKAAGCTDTTPHKMQYAGHHASWIMELYKTDEDPPEFFARLRKVGGWEVFTEACRKHLPRFEEASFSAALR